MAVIDEDLGTRLAQIKGAKLVKSFCYTCPWQCPTEVMVRDGKIVYHKGNPASPNNIGSRCAKGMASVYLPRDPDRLKYPMLRTNPTGQPGQFRRISWDEAFTFIADKLKAIRDQWGPTTVPVCETIPGRHHLDVLHDLADPQARLHDLALRLLGLR